MLNGLIMSEGGYDYSAIQVVLDVHDIEQGRRPAMLAQIVKLIDVVEAERKARRK